MNADFRKLRKRLPKSLRSQLERYEKAGIFQADGAYEHNYAAASARALAPYMYAKRPPARFKHAPPLGMEVLREMWVRRSDFRIDGNLKGFRFHAFSGARQGAEPRRDRRSRFGLDGHGRHQPRRLARATLVVMAECAHMMFIDQTTGSIDCWRSF